MWYKFRVNQRNLRENLSSDQRLNASTTQLLYQISVILRDLRESLSTNQLLNKSKILNHQLNNSTFSSTKRINDKTTFQSGFITHLTKTYIKGIAQVRLKYG